MSSQTNSLYRKNKWYSFTLNPCDDFQYFKEEQPDCRLLKCYNNTLHLLKTYLSDIAEVKLQLEISMPSNSSKVSTGTRIHWHGWIRFTDPFKFLLSIFHRLKGKFIFEIDSIDETDKWKEYVNKDKTYFNKLCKAYDCPYELKLTNEPMQLYLLHKYRKTNDTSFNKYYEKKQISEYT